MTTLGHSLTGIAALTFCLPLRLGWLGRLLALIGFIALASLPDWPLPFWGHRQLAVSHSLWVNLALCALLAALFWKPMPAKSGRTRLLACAAIAWLSHLLLDTLYGDLPGVAIYWPFSDALASLPLPWLKTLAQVPPPFDSAVIRVLLLETLTFAPLVVLGLWLRTKWPPPADPPSP